MSERPIPIDVVVELLIEGVMDDIDYDFENDGSQKLIGVYVSVGGSVIAAPDVGQLRSKVRAYVESLVPQPKLLSECEEGVWFESLQPVQRYGNRAFNPYGIDIGHVSDFQVIQPVEVPK